jgi:hypothetical protein
MLEELPTALTDSQLQANTFGIGVFGFTVWAVWIMGWNGSYDAFGEWESFGHSGPPF